MTVTFESMARGPVVTRRLQLPAPIYGVHTGSRGVAPALAESLARVFLRATGPQRRCGHTKKPSSGAMFFFLVWTPQLPSISSSTPNNQTHPPEELNLHHFSATKIAPDVKQPVFTIPKTTSKHTEQSRPHEIRETSPALSSAQIGVDVLLAIDIAPERPLVRVGKHPARVPSAVDRIHDLVELVDGLGWRRPLTICDGC